MTTTGPTGDVRADVELRLPADSAYVSVLRTTSAGLAARLDFTLDDIEDLRMAVGEASALVLPAAAEGTDMTCRFYMDQGRLTVVVGRGVARRDHVPTPTASPGRCSPRSPATPRRPWRAAATRSR